MIRFFLTLLFVSALMLTVVWVMVDNEWWLETLPSFFYQTIGFLLFGTCLLFIYLYRFDKPDYFVHLYLATMAVKLLAYGAYNFFMVTEDEQQAVKNVAWFMVLYLAFTGIEIVFLYRKISRS